jgi:hypothetical protein
LNTRYEAAGSSPAASLPGGWPAGPSSFGFKKTILAGHLNGAHLILDDFNVFKA